MLFVPKTQSCADLSQGETSAAPFVTLASATSCMRKWESPSAQSSQKPDLEASEAVVAALRTNHESTSSQPTWRPFFPCLPPSLITWTSAGKIQNLFYALSAASHQDNPSDRVQSLNLWLGRGPRVFRPATFIHPLLPSQSDPGF